MPGMMAGSPGGMSMGMVPGMGMPGMPMGAMAMNMGGVGPMRSHGGGRMMNGFGGGGLGGRMQGPYARNDGRSRGMQSKYTSGQWQADVAVRRQQGQQPRTTQTPPWLRDSRAQYPEIAPQEVQQDEQQLDAQKDENDNEAGGWSELAEPVQMPR